MQNLQEFRRRRAPDRHGNVVRERLAIIIGVVLLGLLAAVIEMETARADRARTRVPAA